MLSSAQREKVPSMEGCPKGGVGSRANVPGFPTLYHPLVRRLNRALGWLRNEFTDLMKYGRISPGIMKTG